MSIYLTSDTHFNHGLTSDGYNPERNILAYCHDRGFPNTLQGLLDMNETLIQNWNRVVRPTDTVIHAGDFALGQKIHHPGIMARLNGYKIITRGNHDPSAPKLREFGWDEVHDQYFLEYQGETLWVSHVPVENSHDHVEGRELRRPEATQPYTIAVCGHVHETFLFALDGCLNVGVDKWDLTPVHIDSVISVARSWKHGSIRG